MAAPPRSVRRAEPKSLARETQPAKARCSSHPKSTSEYRSLFFPINGPQLELGDARVRAEGPCSVPVGGQAPIDCADRLGALDNERAFSQLLAIVPGLYLTYSF